MSENLCDICSKRKTCDFFKSIQKDTDDIAVYYGVEFDMIVDAIVKKCHDFKYDKKKIKEVDHICLSCKNSGSCKLWDQVCNIDEDFVKCAFEYDSEIQDVCTAVSYCKRYRPKF